jgi:glutamate--cysteine ligase
VAVANPTGQLDPQILAALRDAPGALNALQRGIEKESLRVSAEGHLSQRPHPPELGSALTHPQITTDFSEAQLELITDVHNDTESCLQQLESVHHYVYQNLKDELLWTSSMPCMLGADSDIPVGRYGTANVAKAKTVYRLGLGNRYGRLMQTISGIHYNFSVPDAFWQAYASHHNVTMDQDLQTRAYFGLIRNFRRFSWLLIYLFGASPAICKSFVKDRDHPLEAFDDGSLYLPYATSLRMGRLGYQSDAQSLLHVSYNSLEEYAGTMRQALTQPYPPYEAIGVKVDGEYRQLNTAILQIENEFYGTIRPKRPIHSGQRPLTALTTQGVEYVEVRCLDLNPFLPLGIDAPEIRFLDSFLLYCLLLESPEDSEAESARMQANQLKVVEEGRRPGLRLQQDHREVKLEDWARDILKGIRPLADQLDQSSSSKAFTLSWEEQLAKVNDPELTPSARVLAIMRSQQLPFFRFAMNQSIAQKGYFDEHPLPEHQRQQMQQAAAESLVRQREIEAQDSVDFDEFLKAYLAFQ